MASAVAGGQILFSALYTTASIYCNSVTSHVALYFVHRC